MAERVTTFAPRAVGAAVAASALAAIAFGVWAPSGPATAQTAAQREWLNPDVTALRDEIAALRAEVARLSGGPVPSGAGLAAAPTGDVFERMSLLETELRRIVGEIERLSLRQDEIARQLGLPAVASGPAPIGSGALLVQSPGQGQDGLPPATAPTEGVLGQIPVDSSGAPLVDTPQFEGAPQAAAGAQAAADPTLTGAPGAPPATPAPAAAAPAASAAANPAAFQEGIGHLRNNEIDLAARKFEEFIAGSPDDARVGDATYWLAETFFARREYAEAATKFLAVVQNHPQADRAPDSLLKLGMSLGRLGKPVEACRTYAEVSKRYPNASPSVLRRADLERSNASCPS